MHTQDSSPEGTEAANIYQIRQSRLAFTLQTNHLDALALNPGSSLTYFTGLHFHLSERPVLAIFVPHNPVIIVLPELEAGKLQGLGYPVQAFPYGEDPSTWAAAFRQAAHAAEIDQDSIGIEPRRMRVLELRLLEGAAPKAGLLPAEDSLAALRMNKDASEITAMQAAVDIAQTALQATLPMIHAGIKEKEIAAELTARLLRSGSESEFPFPPIVSTGPNSANPHAVPSSRALAEGDLLVIDWGATYDGYISDLTRTFAIGQVEAEFQEIASIVLEANAAGRAACKPGARAADVDHAARQVIASAGYGKYFFHRTGHGIGMEAHEEPYIRMDNELVLAPGMAFTVEPGIYLPGRGGVRIEDNIIITAQGHLCLSSLPRQLRNL